jgi:hypothetical protein
MLIKIGLVGVAFEICLSLRIALIIRQDYWKRYEPWAYNVVFAAYLIIGEIFC